MNEPSDFLTDANLAQLLDAARKHIEFPTDANLAQLLDAARKHIELSRVGGSTARPPPQDVLEEGAGGRSLFIGSPTPPPPPPQQAPAEGGDATPRSKIAELSEDLAEQAARIVKLRKELLELVSARNKSAALLSFAR